MRKIFTVVFLVLFVLLTIVLPFRSLKYIYRIYKEFTKPPHVPYREIYPCEKDRSFKNLEDERLYNYVKLGAKCEN